jgi:hypothetical protein
MSKHIVLLGDSIFDNASYVRGENKKDVISHVQSKIKDSNLDMKSTLLAVDGNVIHRVQGSQLARIPSDATHLFVSIGGNNALQAMSLLSQKVGSVGEGFLMASKMLGERFEQEYSSMLDAIQQAAPNAHVTVCFIYNPRFDDFRQQAMSKVGISALNDIILQQAVARKIPIIDLRAMFNEREDYANSIEPSHQGGEKISRAIMDIVQNHDFSKPRTTIYV